MILNGFAAQNHRQNPKSVHTELGGTSMKVRERRGIKRENISVSGAAYRCGDCRVWWGSGVNGRRETAFLQYIPQPVARNLPWDEYRGWRES